MKMIGSGGIIEGMYHLSVYDVIASASTTQAINISSFISLPQQALWHFMLGNMSILHSLLPFIT
jgi:hypothetical protein